MAWKRNVLVVANATLTSEELLKAMIAKAATGPTSFTLVVPANPLEGGREAAAAMLSAGLERLRGAGLETDGAIAGGDPLEAVADVWDPKAFDEVFVSTLPMKFSKWLHAGLPERVGKLTGAPVTHVVSEPPRPELHTDPPPPHEALGVMMGPLSVMGWGGHK